MIHKPQLLVLDEPTNGLDPAGIVEIRQLLRDLADRGVTIFLSSHLLGEVSKLTTRIGIVHEGRLIKEADSSSLAGMLRRRLLVQTRNDERADWPEYVMNLTALVGIGGLIGFGFVFSWLFGREYTDRTVTDLLALPVSRGQIVVAKVIVGVVWCGILSIIAVAMGCVMALILKMDGNGFSDSLRTYSLAAAMTISLSVPVAWSASVGRARPHRDTGLVEKCRSDVKSSSSGSRGHSSAEDAAASRCPSRCSIRSSRRSVRSCNAERRWRSSSNLFRSRVCSLEKCPIK